MNLNPVLQDGHLDYDGDLVSNYQEFQSNSNPGDIFSLPYISINIFYILMLIPFPIYKMVQSLRKIELKRPTLNISEAILKFKVYISDFDNFYEYNLAQQKGATNKKEFELINYYKAPNWKIAQEMMLGEFKSYDDYIMAKALGAPSKSEYDLILRYNAPDFNTALEILKAGFPNYSLYLKASKMNIPKYKEYLEKKYEAEPVFAENGLI